MSKELKEESSLDSLLGAARGAIREAMQKAFSGYNSPLEKIAAAVVSRHERQLTEQIDGLVVSLIGSPEFESDIKEGIRRKFAAHLVSTMSGTLERRLNELKADPAARARITIALDEFAKAAIGPMSSVDDKR